MRTRYFWVLFTTVAFVSSAFAEGRTITRVFWQDEASSSVHWGDLKKSSQGWSIEKGSVEGYPELDSEMQSLVQMRADQGLLLVGVRDSEDGMFGSGWIAIESGVVEEPHGDHSHWRYLQTPRVSHVMVDADQGNPAHVYQDGESFVLANDKKNGFTLTSVKAIRGAKVPADAARFFSGGNGHITLAFDVDSVAYATWIAPAGEHKGRVDVVGLGRNLGKSYAIQCPSGTLHGATMNSGKAFFAPADGVCWVEADKQLDDKPEAVVIHQLSLGEDAEGQPLRTGAFTNIGRHVIFKAGKAGSTKLCWMDASADQPTIKNLSIEVAEGEALSTPTTMRSRYGDKFVVMFGENVESPNKDRMLVVNLDPNGDGNFDDAKLHREIKVGQSQIVGHSGHHVATMLPDGRHALISNPGDGTLCVVSLSDFDVDAEFNLGGVPTRLLVVGK
ncbi:MAG: hypothetical protein AAFX06_31550 [Planctomycetota bacterium]